MKTKEQILREQIVLAGYMQPVNNKYAQFKRFSKPKEIVC